MQNSDVPHGCQFCDYSGPSEILYDGGEAIVITPLNPVTDGHVIVLSTDHCWGPRHDPDIAADVMRTAGRYAIEQGYGDCNFIVNDGALASQTVMHLHLHIVPRRENDGLSLPWTGQEG